MNIINIKINFKKGSCVKKGINLVTGDYNSTKIIFNFDRPGGRKIFEMKNPLGEIILLKEVENNEVILAGKTESGETASLFTEAGDYIFEVSLYDGDSKLTSVYDKLVVNQEQVVVDGKVVEAYLPVFDELLSNVSEALKKTETLNISATKENKTTTITITNKDGSTKTIEILDGEDGPQGTKGDDGVSPTVATESTEGGTKVTITDAEGPKEFTVLNGLDGKDGQNGKDGTPGAKGDKGDPGTTDYNQLENLPQINGETLKGDVSLVKPTDIAGFIKKDVAELDNFYNITQADEKIDEETRDLLKTLSRELKPDEEDENGYSSQTIVNVKNKSGATEMIMEIDNLDIKTNVPTNSVLGTLKGQDLDDRIKALEKNPIPIIEMEATITEEDMKEHILPKLKLDNDQIQTVISNDVSILKVKFNVTKASGTETDTMVFYTTIDNVENINSGATATTIKINAIRTNDEADIIYHGELLGNGSTFASTIDLTPSYIEHRIPIKDEKSTTMELKPNKFYKFDQVTDLNITLGTPENEYVYNEYMFEFVSGETATTLTLPDTVKWLEEPIIEASRTYQCSILNSVGILLGV